MKKSKFSKAVSGILNGAVGMCEKAVKSPRFGMVLAMLCMVSVTFAQNSAGDYSAGTTALGTVTTEIAKYVPVAVKLCYAIAGVVAVVGAISVYIKMNNEEQDVKNILVLKKWRESTRKQMKVNSLSLNYLYGFSTFPILAKMTLKKI